MPTPLMKHFKKILAEAPGGEGCAVAPGSQSGFWRSPTGENHGRDSRPGDVWCEPGDIHDTDRLEAMLNLDIDVKPADGGGWLLIDWRANPPRTTEHSTGRAAIDAALLANTAVSQPGQPLLNTRNPSANP
jgi:hypothetical protein